MIDNKMKQYLDKETATKPPEWFVSKRGNPCMKVGDHLITVFKAKQGGFKWVINTNDERGEPMWSKGFCVTPEQAKADALSAVGAL
jgi:hypothetical protein